MPNRCGKSGNSDRLYFLGLQNHCGWWHHHKIKRLFLLGRKAVTNLDSILKNRGITLLTKVRTDKAMVSPVVMYRCERWIIKKVEQNRIDAFELESPLYCKEIKSTHPKGNQPWIFTGMTNVEAPIFWLPDAKNWLTGKDPDAGKDKRRRRWRKMRWLDSITNSMDMNLSRFREIDSGRQRSLACHSPWGYKLWDMT